MVHPTEIKPIDRPSTFHRNLSLSIIGVSIAVMMILKHEVDAIKIRLPNFSANALKA